MALSGVLKKKGHKIDVLIAANENDLIAKLKTIEPDVIGISVHSLEHKWLRQTVSDIRTHLSGVPIIAGGIHPTLYPEEVMKLDVDYICCGEGEFALAALIERLEKGQRSAKGIEGIGYTENNLPVLQGAATIASELDQFPEDRSIYYDRYAELGKLDLKLFMSGRGCPFECAYCGNALRKQIYKCSDSYIRKKTPRFFVDEIRQVVDRYGAKSFYFMDDIFILDYNWLVEFMDIYMAEIKLPYFCMGHATFIKEKHADILARSGCRNICIGLETGNEHIRKNVLNKIISDNDFSACSNILKKHGIKLVTSNMFCLPDETVKDAMSTVDLNLKIGANHMASAIFLPYPKTKLAEYCIEKGLLDKNYSVEDLPPTYLFKSVLKKNDKEIFGNVHKISELCIMFPRAKHILFFASKRLRFSALFNFLYLVGVVLRYKDTMELSLFQTIMFFWTQRKQSG